MDNQNHNIALFPIDPEHSFLSFECVTTDEIAAAWPTSMVFGARILEICFAKQE
jgi:hypothetical protein